jgi:hypothetical protein
MLPFCAGMAGPIWKSTMSFNSQMGATRRRKMPSPPARTAIVEHTTVPLRNNSRPALRLSLKLEFVFLQFEVGVIKRYESFNEGSAIPSHSISFVTWSSVAEHRHDLN